MLRACATTAVVGMELLWSVEVHVVACSLHSSVTRVTLYPWAIEACASATAPGGPSVSIGGVC